MAFMAFLAGSSFGFMVGFFTAAILASAVARPRPEEKKEKK